MIPFCSNCLDYSYWDRQSVSTIIQQVYSKTSLYSLYSLYSFKESYIKLSSIFCVLLNFSLFYCITTFSLILTKCKAAIQTSLYSLYSLYSFKESYIKLSSIFCVLLNFSLFYCITTFSLILTKCKAAIQTSLYSLYSLYSFKESYIKLSSIFCVLLNFSLFYCITTFSLILTKCKAAIFKFSTPTISTLHGGIRMRYDASSTNQSTSISIVTKANIPILYNE